MIVEVLAGGLQTTVQDLGRFGCRHLGVGASGAVDGFSPRVGNMIVGNPQHTATLEITLQGPRLRFAQVARIAITGADVDVQADGIAIPAWRYVDLPVGCELAFGSCRRGARAYLAIAGGMQVAPILGSASTDLRASFGGLNGRALAAGDLLRLNTVAGDMPSPLDSIARPSPSSWWLDPRPDLDLSGATPFRLLPGRDALDPGSSLWFDTFRVSAQSNRQGLRLHGPALTLADNTERLSEPVAPGTVQLPPDGQPIVLLCEGQTIGGYPRIGHVISADLPRLAQLRPGDGLRFEPIDVEGAHALASAQRHRLSRMALAIGQRLREN